MTRKPSVAETRALKLIANHGGLLLTYVDDKAQFSTACGWSIETRIAQRLIKRGWLIADSDSLFGCASQRYRCLTPTREGEL